MRLTALRRFCAAGAAALLLVQPAFAQRAPMIDALIAALRIDETVAVMQAEGAVYGNDIADQMLPDVNRDSWAQTIARIYDPARMADQIGDRFDVELRGHDMDPILDYLREDDVREIISLEISARRAFLDADTEAAAKTRFAQMDGQGVRLLEQVETIMNDSDLVEANVAGALNADLMFYRGLVEGGAFDMSEDEILSEVWTQEDTLRDSSREWLQAFLMMAYQPVDPDALDDYAAFWRTDEGKVLNRALFAAFDQMYEEISYELGRAVAREMTSERL